MENICLQCQLACSNGGSCSESQASDGYYTWRTNLFLDDPLLKNHDVLNAIHKPFMGEDGKPCCVAFVEKEIN